MVEVEEEISLLDRSYDEALELTRRHKDRPVEASCDGITELLEFSYDEANSMLIAWCGSAGVSVWNPCAFLGIMVLAPSLALGKLFHSLIGQGGPVRPDETHYER